MGHQLEPTRIGARAIDVGYFNVKYTTGRNNESNNEVGCGLFPALAPRITHNNSLMSPGTSGSDGCYVNVDGVNYFVGRGAAFNSSGLETRPVEKSYCMSDKYLALLRGALHYIAEDAKATQDVVIDQLVLGLPLNNFKEFHERLVDRVVGEHHLTSPKAAAGKRRITVKNARVIVQPQGALINFGYNGATKVADGWTLVIDPGGGTLDWFLSRGNQPNWQRSGAYPKSMLACSYAVADMINPGWKDQFEIIDRIDKAIRSKADTFSVAGETYTLSNYQTGIEAVLEESVQYMLNSIGPTDSLDTIIMTGGGAKVFYEYMATHHPRLAKIATIDNDPVFSNVRGFHILGEMFINRHSGNKP